MALLRPVEIAEHASRAGFRGADLQTVVAVGLAESGVGTPLNRKGRSDAHKVTSKEDSRGLLQINVKAWPQFAGQDLYDPATNLRAARVVLREQGWGAWSDFTNGQFMLYMAAAGAGVQSMRGDLPTGDPIGDPLAAKVQTGVIDPVAGGLKGLVDAAGRVTAWVTTPANILRIVYVVVGGALLVGALLRVAPTDRIVKLTPAGALAG